MKNLLNSILHRIKPFLFKWRDHSIKKSFEDLSDTFAGESVVVKYRSDLDLNSNCFVYKDNTWNHIKYIGTIMWSDMWDFGFISLYRSLNKYTDNACPLKKVEVKDQQLICTGNGEKDDWIFLMLNESFDNAYSIEFEAMIETVNSEFQIAFNYQDIGNRYRFNLKNNNVLCFEVVSKGFFHNEIFSKKFSLPLNEFNKFRINVLASTYQYLVNDKIIMTIAAKRKLFNGDKFAFILWDTKQRPISAIYKNIKIIKY